MKRIVLSLTMALLALFAVTGCGSMVKNVTDSAAGKNLWLDGYVMLGEVEMNSSETGTPTGKMIMGRLTYKSRKVGIPADQKTPNTGSFKATKVKSLFGTEEQTFEYDFTAGSDAEAKAAVDVLEKKKKAAEDFFEASDESDTAANAAASEEPASGTPAEAGTASTDAAKVDGTE